MSINASKTHMRKPGLHKYCQQGWHWSPKLNKRVPYKSGYEQKYMVQLDGNENVIWYDYEPKNCRITYEFDGMKRIYIPDFLVRYADGSRKMVELKSTWTVTFDRAKAKLEALDVLSKSGRLPFQTDVIIGKGRDMAIKQTISFKNSIFAMENKQ